MSEGQRRVVLTEEDYTSKLSSIVARDFFPDVSKLEQQNALLDKRLEGDLAGAIAVRRATRRLVNEEEEEAERRERDDQDLATNSHIRKRPRPLHDESLTGFMARATNEDDHEFDTNQKREIKENRERLAEVFGTNSKDSISGDKPRNLLLEMASDDFAPESNRIEWQKPKARNPLFFNPTPVHPPLQNYNGTKVLLLEGSSSAKANDESSLMPPPSKQQTAGILSIHKVEQKNAKRMPKSELVEYIPKHNLEKKIEPSATRFPAKGNFLSKIGGNTIFSEEIDSASDTDYTTDASTDLDAPLRSIEEERRRFQQKQQKRPYVTMTPQIIPGTAGNESPITTWGTVDGTPIVLSGKEEPSPSPFRIAETSQREDAATRAELKMAKRTKLAKTSKSKSKKRNLTTTKGSLTPAAMSLLEKTRGSQKGGAFVSALRTSYTPRPSSLLSRKGSKSRTSSKTRRRDHAYNATPQL